MKTLAHFVHGFNVTDGGARSVDSLKPALDPFRSRVNTRDFDYGYLGFLGVRLLNRRFGNMLSNTIMEQDLLIGHSNGCALISNAVKRGGLGPRLCFLVAPALDEDYIFDEKLFPYVVILYTKHDLPLKFAKYIPFSKWGGLGAYGPKEPTRNVKAIDCSSWVRGHSHYFHEENLSRTRAILTSEVRHAFAM